MKWISNNDPPLYVWYDDLWYDQKTKILYKADLELLEWTPTDDKIPRHLKELMIKFPKKTKILIEK